MTYNELLARRELLLLDCISGSHAYNLNLPGSDTDRKGIFILPRRDFYGFAVTEQVASEKNDEVYFEIKRFLELLLKNNPNILELLYIPEQFVLFRHPLMDLIKPGDFLSKLCFDTFAGYAQTQVKKARGLNKKINNPIAAEKKSVLDFCYVIENKGSIPLTGWLEKHHLLQQDCGLAKVDHFRDVYLLYHSSEASGFPAERTNGVKFKGIVSGPDADNVQLSPVPENLEPLTTLNFNKDGYSAYCRDYREYREWEAERNQVRFESTLAHGKSYDAKNMMHTFRLLNMAKEIAVEHRVNVYRRDRDFLLSIRAGHFEFDELMNMVDEQLESIRTAFDHSDLQDKPDELNAENLLFEIRDRFYRI